MYTYEQMQKVYQLYDNGCKWKDIEKETGLKPGSIQNILKKRSQSVAQCPSPKVLKTTKKLCATCAYSDGCISDPTCIYRIITGTSRNCPTGWCDKHKVR